MDTITNELRKHYAQKFSEFGATPKGVDWNREADVVMRYEKMLAVIEDDKSQNLLNSEGKTISLLDVGCGYGGLYRYVQENRIDGLEYTGIDVVESMIEYANSQHCSDSFICEDIFNYQPNSKFDYVVCNGILTQKLSASIKDADIFCNKLIRKLFDLCSIGVAFNVMTTKVNYMVDNLYYKNPVELLGFCLSEITSKFKIDHSYPLYEYTVYLYRE